MTQKEDIENLREAVEYFAEDTQIPQKETLKDHYKMWNDIIKAAKSYLKLTEGK